MSANRTYSISVPPPPPPIYRRRTYFSYKFAFLKITHYLSEKMKKQVKALGIKFGEKGKEKDPKPIGRFKMGDPTTKNKTKKDGNKSNNRAR